MAALKLYVFWRKYIKKRKNINLWSNFCKTITWPHQMLFSSRIWQFWNFQYFVFSQFTFSNPCHSFMSFLYVWRLFYSTYFSLVIFSSGWDFTWPKRVFIECNVYFSFQRWLSDQVKFITCVRILELEGMFFLRTYYHCILCIF